MIDTRYFIITCILRFDSKDNTFEFGHFMTISGHLSQNLRSDGHFDVLNKSKS